MGIKCTCMQLVFLNRTGYPEVDCFTGQNLGCKSVRHAPEHVKVETAKAQSLRQCC